MDKLKIVRAWINTELITIPKEVMDVMFAEATKWADKNEAFLLAKKATLQVQINGIDAKLAIIKP